MSEWLYLDKIKLLYFVKVVVFLSFVLFIGNDETKADVGKQRQNCSDERTLCILCFGDSITQGYHGIEGVFHPYTESLRNHLTKKYPDVYVRIFTRGRGGDMVHGRMLARLERELSRENFDLVLILAGVNDLIMLTYEQNQDLFKRIMSLHQVALDRGVLRTVSMTMLQAEPSQDKLKYLTKSVFEAMRTKINDEIRAFNSTDTTNCDVEECFPTLSSDSFYWEKDMVHPSPLGYDMLGKCLFTCLVGDIEFLLDIKELKGIMHAV